MNRFNYKGGLRLCAYKFLNSVLFRSLWHQLCRPPYYIHMLWKSGLLNQGQKHRILKVRAEKKVHSRQWEGLRQYSHLLYYKIFFSSPLRCLTRLTPCSKLENILRFLTIGLNNALTALFLDRLGSIHFTTYLLL